MATRLSIPIILALISSLTPIARYSAYQLFLGCWYRSLFAFRLLVGILPVLFPYLSLLRLQA